MEYGKKVLQCSIVVKHLKPYEHVGYDGSYDSSTKTVVLVFRKNMSVLDKIITLSHELGHRRDDIYHSKINKKEEEAYNKLDDLIANADAEPLPEWAKDLSMNIEERACQYSIQIMHELRLKIPMLPVYVADQLIRWEYRHAADHGILPSYCKHIKFRKDTREKLRKKYGNKRFDTI
jgi:hypothetical protein